MTGFHFRSNLTFANTQDIFAIFEDEMFVEVFRRLDNIQRLAKDIVSNSDFKLRPPYLRNYYKRSYRDPKDRGSTRRNENETEKAFSARP